MGKADLRTLWRSMVRIKLQMARFAAATALFVVTACGAPGASPENVPEVPDLTGEVTGLSPSADTLRIRDAAGGSWVLATSASTQVLRRVGTQLLPSNLGELASEGPGITIAAWELPGPQPSERIQGVMQARMLLFDAPDAERDPWHPPVHFPSSGPAAY